ncbi:MAG: DUF4215 domain-containing protein [Myxococcota bacterium]
MRPVRNLLGPGLALLLLTSCAGPGDGASSRATALSSPHYGAENAAGVCLGARMTLAGAIAAAGASGTVYVSAQPSEIVEFFTATVFDSVTLLPAGTDADAGACVDDPLARPTVKAFSRAIRLIDVVASGVDKVVTIRGVHLTHEADPATFAGDGGTISAGRNTTLALAAGARVSNGHATGSGGCIFAFRSTVITDFTVSIDDCEADLDGGGVAIVRRNQQNPLTNVVARVTGSSAGGDGGGIHVDRANVSAFTLQDNTAGNDGGGLYFTSAGLPQSVRVDADLIAGRCTSTLDDCTEGNRAGGDGGSAFVTGRSSRFSMAGEVGDGVAGEEGGGVHVTNRARAQLCPNTALYNSFAQSHGGGIYANASSIVRLMTDCEPLLTRLNDRFTIPKPPYEGLPAPAPCPFDGPGWLSLLNTPGPILITGNHAGWLKPALPFIAPVPIDPTRLGGGIALFNADASVVVGAAILLDDVRIDENRATQDGGGLAVTQTSTWTVEPGDGVTGPPPIQIALNRATNGQGGGVFASGASLVSFNDTFGVVEILDNVASDGAALAITNGSSLALGHAEIVGNVATSGVGGVVVDDSAAVLGTAVAGCGGLASVNKPCLRIEENESTGVDGSAVDAVDSVITLRRGIVRGNIGAAGGASVAVRGTSGSATMANVTVGDSSLDGFRLDVGTLDCDHCTFFRADDGLQVTSPAVATVDNSLSVQNNLDTRLIALLPAAALNGSCNTSTAPVPVPGWGSVDAAFDVDQDGRPTVINADNQCSVGLEFDVQRLTRPDPAGAGVPGAGAPANTITLSDAGAFELPHACGDGVLAWYEACDDGNFVDTDACSNTCTPNP